MCLLSIFGRKCHQIVNKSLPYLVAIGRPLSKNFQRNRGTLATKYLTNIPFQLILTRCISQNAAKDPNFIELCQKVHPIINNTGISQMKRIEAIEAMFKQVNKSDIIIMLQYCHFAEVFCTIRVNEMYSFYFSGACCYFRLMVERVMTSGRVHCTQPLEMATLRL